MFDMEAGKKYAVLQPSNVKAKSSILCTIFVTCSIIIMLTISILDLTFANIYADTVCVKNNITTTDYLYNPITWLNVSGGVGIVLTFFGIIPVICMKIENRMTVIDRFIYVVWLGELFVMCWNLFGIFVFARSCHQIYTTYSGVSVMCNNIISYIRFVICNPTREMWAIYAISHFIIALILCIVITISKV